MGGNLLGVWINVSCLKCGNKEMKKYYVSTLNEFNKFFDINCPCGNNDTDKFELLEIDSSNGKLL